MNAPDVLLWVILPYVALTIFIGGHVWRYRHDKFGWTTRSSQLHEQRLLRLGGPLFHFGILVTIGGHVVGILVPAGWTRALGIEDSRFHLVALGLGTLAGASAVAGLAILGYRRVKVRPVARGTLRNDRIMYVVLAATLLLGLGTTVFGSGHDYRETVAPWFRSVLMFMPDGELMTGAPLGFQLHALSAWVLLAWWPFSSLVHVFSAPVGFLVRPYIVYRG